MRSMPRLFQTTSVISRTSLLFSSLTRLPPSAPPNATLSGRGEHRERRSVEARSWAARGTFRAPSTCLTTNGNAVVSSDLHSALGRHFRERDHLVHRHDMSSGHRQNYQARTVDLGRAHGTVAHVRVIKRPGGVREEDDAVVVKQRIAGRGVAAVLRGQPG